MFSFFFNDTATTEIYTLSLHDALPISAAVQHGTAAGRGDAAQLPRGRPRSEEHTSELQSRQYLVCRLLLVKKKSYTTSAAGGTERHVSHLPSSSRLSLDSTTWHAIKEV